MSRLEHIKAVAHPLGGKIDIRWLNPEPLVYTGVLVKGREGSHPVSPQDGHTVAGGGVQAPLFNVDVSFSHNLDAKVVSQTLSDRFTARQLHVSTAARVTVTQPGARWQVREGEDVYLLVRTAARLDVYGVTRVQDTGLGAGKTYYYTLFPYKGTPPEYVTGTANRASALCTGSVDFAGRMYRSLPVIYHRYDTRLPGEKEAVRAGMVETDKKRGQLRRFLDIPGSMLDQFNTFAASVMDAHDIERVDGALLPLLGNWLGWDIFFNKELAGKRNELRHAPSIMQGIGLVPTLETVVRLVTGWDNRVREFVHNIFLSNDPDKLNLWKARKDSTGKWHEDSEVFSLDYAFEGRNAVVTDGNGVTWLFYHTRRSGHWDIWYKTYHEDSQWSPSQPLTVGPPIDKHPTAVIRNGVVTVYWNCFDKETGKWSILSRENTNGQWTETKTFSHGLPDGAERKSPRAVVDGSGGMLLFWQEKSNQGVSGTKWVWKYNRYSGTSWELDAALPVPADSGANPRIGDDLFVFTRLSGGTRRICFCWSRRKILSTGGRGGSEIALREKTGTGMTTGWGAVRAVPHAPSSFHYRDTEPAAIAESDGSVHLFWSSDRSGGKTLWTMDIADMSGTSAALDIADAKQVLQSDYSQRWPLPYKDGGDLILVYRSDRGIAYQGAQYRDFEETDYLTTGSMSLETRNQPMTRRMGKYNDSRDYTYDTGTGGTPTPDTWYTPETVGIYLTPDTADLPAVTEKLESLKSVLARFMPIQTRAVFIVAPPVTAEMVYTNDFPAEPNQRFIREEHSLRALRDPETYGGVTEGYTDTVPEWNLLKSWSAGTTAYTSVDFGETPVDYTSRSWHNSLKWE